MKKDFSSDKYFSLLDQYFRAANYLSVAQLYLLDNPLLTRPLKMEDIKKKLVGHWGTVPGQNFVYAHMNRAITKYDLNMILISGPGHGGNFFIANSYLEGTYSEFYPEVSEDEKGLTRLCKQFSFPCGVSSHVSPEVPGSINEGGELGYSLAHGFGAVMDNPSLIATVIVGDGEAETGPLATSWHSNKFINPASDGAVLPILHLNGYKIANPTVLSRMPKATLKKLFEGYGYKPYFVEGDEPMAMHKKMAEAVDKAIEEIKEIQSRARGGEKLEPVWPMIILRTPKGWTGPKEINGKQVEGTFRAHQIPITIDSEENFKALESWLKSYHAEELFKNFKLKPAIKAILPKGERRISANPHANGGALMKKLKVPAFTKYGVKISAPGQDYASDMTEAGALLRDVFKLNKQNNNFRMFSPDEMKSNRLNKMFEATKRRFNVKIYDNDEDLSPDGRIIDSFLSEHACEGWLEGYLLTGRHGMFVSYEAFMRVVDSMVTQHAKWIKMSSEIRWRKEIPSLNLILSSVAWQQDHNGYTHQDPGFLDHLNNKKAEITRMYLPADANCLLACTEECLKSKNKINAIITSKYPTLQWLTASQAKEHCEKGAGIWDFACAGNKKNPDLVMASAGSIPTLESLAAIKILKEYLPNLSIRCVNVLELEKLVSSTRDPHGLTDKEYDALFTKDKPIVFNFHGYPHLIHDLTYNRNNRNLHVRGYSEEGTITTPFDMRVLNKIDRFNLVLLAIKYIKIDAKTRRKIEKDMNAKLTAHKNYIAEYGVDMPEIQNWKW